MLRETPFWKLLQWRAFDQIEPFGEHRADWHAAQICATLMNIAAKEMKFRPRDLLIEFKDPEVVGKEAPVTAAPAARPAA